MEWFLVFLFNLRVPVGFICFLGGALCLWFGLLSGSRDPHVRSGAGIAAVILSVIFVIVMSIPKPDYKVEYRDRIVYHDRKVPVPVYKGVKEVPSTYQSVYYTCINTLNVRVDTQQSSMCHKQAMEASRPLAAVRIVYKPSPYNDLFKECNENWTGSIQNMDDPEMAFKSRQERMSFCRDYAEKGATIH